MDNYQTSFRDHDDIDCDLERKYPSENSSRKIVVDKCEAENYNFSMKQCLFCLNLEKADNTHSSLNSTWFKMLLRYLEINETSTLDGKSGNPGDGRGFICEKCVSLGKEFWKWYEHFETIRLCLDRCIRSLLDIFKEKRCPEDISSLPISHSEFRSLAIKKCLMKIGSNPKVLLDRRNASHPLETADGDKYDIFTMRGNIDPFLISCNNCSLKFKDQYELRSHVIVQHPFEFHSKDLPPGVDLEPMEKDTAIQTALQWHRQHPKNLKLKKGIDCLTCARHISHRCNFRKHFLMYHFSEVLEHLPLKTDEDESPSEPKIIPSLSLKQEPVDGSEPHSEQNYNYLEKVDIDHHRRPKALSKSKSSHYLQRCNLCKSSFKTLKALQFHRKTSNGDPKRCKLSTCTVCGKYFTSKITCWRHWKSHNPHNGKHSSFLRAECKFCGKIFRDIYELRVHQVRHHTFQLFAPKLPPTTTEEEFKATIKIAVEKCHGKSWQKGGVRCTKCGKQFTTANYFEHHILEKHFDQVSYVLRQNKKANGDGEVSEDEAETILGQECQEDNANEEAPSKKLRRQTYLCNLCNMSFRKLTTLQIHQKTSNGDPKRCSLFSCQVCGKSFTSNTVCWRHQKRHNPLLGKSSSLRSAECVYCGKVQKDKYSIRAHEINIHTLQVYANQLPPQTTNRKLKKAIKIAVKDHISHEKNRHAEKKGVTECIKCGKQFQKAYSIQPHILHKHFGQVVEVLKKDTLSRMEEDENSSSDIDEGNDVSVPTMIKEEGGNFTTEIDLDMKENEDALTPHYKEDAETILDQNISSNEDCKGLIINSFSLAANDDCDSDLDAHEGEDVILGC